MNYITIQPAPSIALFVKDILVFEEPDRNKSSSLPFFADGYPGLMFQNTTSGLTVQPHNKKMPALFLYGQTIHPIELHMDGAYKLIVFQLYPFVLKSLFNIAAIDLNDNCYDLEQVTGGKKITRQLSLTKDDKARIDIISHFILSVFKTNKQAPDTAINEAIQLITQLKGQISIKEVCEKIHLTKRTFERRFLSETGILPKQFATITRFQQSLEELTSTEYKKLTDIVYNNGFADQSHFIKVFKAYTGKTPKKFVSVNR